MYSNSLICNILKYINNNINNKITIEDIEKEFHYNRYYIMKLFKKELKITIIDYINKIRIYNSITYMRQNNQNLLNIAYKNGFYSIEYYSEIFKKIIGIKAQIVKKHFKGKKINYEDLRILNKKITELYTLKEDIIKYLSNEQKIITTPKVLSIFK